MSNYNYTGAGLKNVWLLNGFKHIQTPYGEATAIDDVEGLHQALALRIIDSKKTLSGLEFRFLRKEMCLSQSMVAKLFGYQDQTVANWEKSKTKIPKLADSAIRALYAEKTRNMQLRELLEKLDDIDRVERAFYFKETKQGWKPREAA